MEELIRSFFATTNKNEEKWSGCVRLQRHPYFHLNICVLVNLNILTMNIFLLDNFCKVSYARKRDSCIKHWPYGSFGFETKT